VDRWNQFELFVQVAELGSLSRAARALGMSNAAASRCLAALEERLGARLVERSTRRLGLSQMGEQFYRHCKAALTQMKEAEEIVNANAVAPSGMLRVTSSLSFCMKHISPILPRFQALSDITLDLMAANRYVDLLDSGIDIAIRTREFEPDSNVAVRRLGGHPAHPGSLARLPGRPRQAARLEELAEHDLLVYSHANDPHRLRFSARDGQQHAGDQQPDAIQRRPDHPRRRPGEPGHPDPAQLHHP
jgi:DNA-binding transcriptional LysR family regulator